MKISEHAIISTKCLDEEIKEIDRKLSIINDKEGRAYEIFRLEKTILQKVKDNMQSLLSFAEKCVDKGMELNLNGYIKNQKTQEVFKNKQQFLQSDIEI